MNLVIGNTSQLAQYFPEDYIRISSRNINLNEYVDVKYDSVYITFAEQRTYDTNISQDEFININVTYTSYIIDHFSRISDKVIIYGTAELWNKYDGSVNITNKIDYKYSHYTRSKDILYSDLINNRTNGKWGNVYIIHPFNFNSIYRKEGFLFYKIFDSLVNKTKIQVGYLDINRDIIHPKYLVEKSINCKEDLLIGSGVVTNIKEFIQDLYRHYNLDYNEYVTEEYDAYSIHKGNVYYSDTITKYTDLLKDTIEEINIKYERN